ncbi:hypothetical protein B0H21DRAFT_712745, partial [Amylocystis lapponica]
ALSYNFGRIRYRARMQDDQARFRSGQGDFPGTYQFTPMSTMSTTTQDIAVKRRMTWIRSPRKVAPSVRESSIPIPSSGGLLADDAIESSEADYSQIAIHRRRYQPFGESSSMSKHHESTTSTPKPAAHPLVGPLSIVQRTAQSVGHPELETTSAQSPVSASTSSVQHSSISMIHTTLTMLRMTWTIDFRAAVRDVIVVTSDDDDMYGAESNIPKYTHSQIESDDDGDQTVPTYTRSQIELDDDGDRIASVVQLLVLIFYFTSDRQVDPVSDYTPTPPSRVPSDNATRRKSRNASSSARTAQVLSQASSSISGTARTIMPHSPPSPSESRRKKKARVIVPTM